MTDKLHNYASRDTPENVPVPTGLAPLIVWATGRFGTGAVFAAVCMWGMGRVYQDQRELTQQVLVSFNKQAEVTAKNSSAIDSLTRAVETLTRDQRAQDAAGRRGAP